MNKYKIINDPVYGFVDIPSELIYDVLSHPYFQRLRRIRQMGLADMVYPGATHTRFHHAVGAMHLMQLALNVLQDKGQALTELEIEGALLAILLHDVGHGPFSHTLETSLLHGVNHEQVSLKIFQKLNEEFDNRLEKAIDIFRNRYPKPFLHQLVSGQLDTDRMDYLNRDSFYTGVAEGVIGYDRIIKMLDVHDGNLVIEEKGIYSVEKFIISRRLMYWQVYLHKTSIAADRMLINILRRAKDLYRSGESNLLTQSNLSYFIENDITYEMFQDEDIHLEKFVELDDTDIMHALKVWKEHRDPILSFLSKRLIDRKLFKVKYLKDESGSLDTYRSVFYEKYPEMKSLDAYLFEKDTVVNNAYIPGRDSILVKMKDGSVKDIAQVAEVITIKSLSNPTIKNYICYPDL